MTHLLFPPRRTVTATGAARVTATALLLVASSMARPRLVLGQSTPHEISCQLRNGDHLTGRVTRITRTYVRIVNIVLGRVSIYRPDIVICESDDPAIRQQIVELLPPPRPSVRNISPVRLSSEPRQLALVRGRAIPREALARKPVVVPLSPALPTSLSTVGWKRRINLTYALARGNANTADLGFVGSVTRRAARSQAALTATRRLGRNNGNVAADFSQATFRYDLALGPTDAAAAMRPSYFSESTWERDPMAKLKRRLIENTGLSIPLSPDPISNLALELGVGITHTAFVGEEARTHMGALIRLAAKQKFGSAKTDQQVSSYPDLVGPTLHYRFDTNFNLAAPLNKTVALKIGFINRYDTKPRPGVKRNDAIVQSGLGIEF